VGRSRRDSPSAITGLSFGLSFWWELGEPGQREAQAAVSPAEAEAAIVAGDHLRADEGLERAGDGRSEAGRIDLHLADDEGLADVRAALLLDDLDELGLERP
jgi:hypothetical protein